MRFSELMPWRKARTVHPQGNYPDPWLKDLILFVTDRCNMKCDHCMFWERIDNPGDELSLEQMGNIARSTPPLRTLSLTGGEPFLRNDLVRILEIFYQFNHTHHIQVNTNGLLMERMEQLVKKDLALQYEHFLTYQVSIDGLSETHDRVRRMPGSFEKIIRNLKRLVALQQDHPYFHVVVLTNVNRNNYKDIEPLADLLWNEVGVDHVYDLVRGISPAGIPEDIVVHEDPRDCDLPRRN